MNKEMTIVWHDLIEDSTDLPSISNKSSVWSEDVYVQTKSGHRCNAAYRHGVNRPGLNEEEGWYNDFTTKLNKDDIVAWTYIPRYRNREKRIDDLLLKLSNAMEFHRIKKGKTEVYPKTGQFIILFQYKDGEGIVSGPGFYDKEIGWMITPSVRVEQLIDIDNLIGWSTYFKVNDNVSDSDEKE